MDFYLNEMVIFSPVRVPRTKRLQIFLSQKKGVRRSLFSPHFPIAERDEKFKKMKNFASTKNALIVTGLPKTGSHLTMSILDSFGFERAEDLGDENGITAMPFDFQHKLKG